MDTFKKILFKIIFITCCSLCGGITGVILLVLLTLIISFSAINSSGGDESAGAVSYVGMILVPVAAQYGLIAGFTYSLIYPLVRSRLKLLRNPRTGKLSKRHIPS